MSVPIKQHYVPQTYLKNFSYSKKHPYQVYVIHKHNKNIFPTNIKNTAAERHFYTVKKHPNNYVWENYYAENIEPLMKNVISEILIKSNCVLLQDNATVLTSELKVQIATIMMFQFFRGKYSRDLEKKIFKDELPGVIKKTREIFGPLDEEREKILEDYNNEDDYFKLVAMEVTLNIEKIEKYINILLQRLFIVLKIVGVLEFVTSDHPVMFVNSFTLDATPFKNGLADHSTVVFFPLSPNVILAAYHPNQYFGKILDLDGKVIILDDNKESKFIEMLNTKQYEQCYDQVYARKKSILESFIGKKVK